ncbi:putative amino acid transporter PAT1 [Trypanosoma grayi]|uniref:putative amino acid transporter PAT1 n=1 Tax=Trypanosoma grayi TaxID=71804 RepID=UPI0004F4709D|nr:putative amino acid transporter PAT1 [Trypanosoma grayi]KEG06732.1 putative amino acid transporter PAT1 [Trypanosoma grayi]
MAISHEIKEVEAESRTAPREIAEMNNVSADQQDAAHRMLRGAPGNIQSPLSPKGTANLLLPLEAMEEEIEASEEEMRSVHPEPESGPLDSAPGALSKIIPPGGLLSTVFNLVSICVGAGILGLPAAANSSGLLMALFYPMVIVVLSVYSLYCLAVQMERFSLKTYEGMSRTLLGPGFDHFTAAMRLLNTFGSSVASIIGVGDLFSAILDNTDAPDYWKSTSGNRLLTTLLFLAVMLPLVIPRHINSLRYVSTLGVGFIVYFVVTIIVHSCMNGLPDNASNIHVAGTPKDDGIHLFGTGNKALDGLGVFLFAFLCQVNSFEVYWDMAERSASRFTLYCAIAMAVCFFLNLLTAIFGYLDFGSRVTGSVLLMYDPVKEPAVMVAYVGVLVKLCASFPLLMMASRNAVYHTVGWDPDTLPFWKHCIAAVFLAFAALICGLFIPNINTVFGFLGAFCGGTMAFMFPAILMMYAGSWSLRSVGWMHYILTYALLFAGIIMVVFGTGATIYGVAVGS